MPKNKDNEFDISLLETDISAGIDNFINKHKEKNEFTTDYSVEKKCGLNDNSIRTIRKSGGATLKTLYRLGLGVGKKPKVIKMEDGSNTKLNSQLSVITQVLKDFEGK